MCYILNILFFVLLILSCNANFTVDLISNGTKIECGDNSEDFCVNLCCQSEEIIDLNKRGFPCVPSLNSSWSLDKMTEHQHGVRSGVRPRCPKDFNLRGSEDRRGGYTVLANGTLQITQLNTPEMLSPRTFCLGVTLSGFPTALVCRPLRYIAYNPVFVGLVVLSATFALATLLVYAVLPKLRRTETGFSLMAHCACMLVAHVVYVVESGVRPGLGGMSCSIFAYLKLYALLAGFFWLNVICIDIALKFRSLNTLVESGPLNRRRVAWYFLYATGSPLLVVLIGVLADSTEDTSFVMRKLRTNIGQSYCWFDSATWAEFMYCLAPVGLLLLLDVGYFIDAIVKIKSFARKSADSNYPKELKKQARKNFDVRKNKRLALFAKLLALLGLSWLLEVIAWSMEFTQQHPLWVFIFCVHFTRTVATFVLFCCKRKVWRLLTSRFPVLRHLHVPRTTRYVPTSQSESRQCPAGGDRTRRSSESRANQSMPRDLVKVNNVQNSNWDTL